MKTFFLEEANDIGLFHKIKRITKNGNKLIINRNIKRLKLKNKEVLVKKIKKILERENTRQVAIAKKLKEDEQFVKLLYGKEINICSPKWILKNCTDKIVDLVLKEKKKEEREISICVNEIDSLVEEYIYKFAKEFKRVNIITNHIGKFRKIEEKLYNEEGILLNISNNRRKSLIKAELILNVDFPKELINDFSIYDKSIIINWDEPLKIRKRRFNGKIIEEIKISKEKENQIFEMIEKNNLQNYDERDVSQVFGIVPCKINLN